MADGGSYCSEPPWKAIAHGTRADTAGWNGPLGPNLPPQNHPCTLRLQGTRMVMPSSAHISPTSLKEYFHPEPREYLCQSEHSNSNIQALPMLVQKREALQNYPQRAVLKQKLH